MNVYEYVMVYRVRENPRSATTGCNLRFLDRIRGVELAIAESSDELRKQLIHGLKLPDGVDIKDVGVLVRPFVSQSPGLCSGTSNWLPLDR